MLSALAGIAPLWAVAWAAPTAAETLADAVALAYQTNPTLQGARAQQRALDETYVQAEAGYRPTVTVRADVVTDRNNYLASASLLPGENPAITKGDTQTSAATLTIAQPVYTGGRVSSAVNAAKAGILAGREGLRGTEQDVLDSVIQAYLDVRRDAENLKTADENVSLLQSQLGESKAKFEVGQVTRTDVAQSDARLASAQAAQAMAQAQLDASRAVYVSVVGQTPAQLAAPPSLDGLMPMGLDQAFAAAERNNPQLRRSSYLEQASAAKVAEARAQNRPIVSLRANLGYSGGNYGLATPFANYSHDVSVAAVVTVPLFDGGVTLSQVRQALEADTVDRIGVEAARRQVVLMVAKAWSQLAGLRASVEAREREVSAADLTFDGAREEALVGARSTLDVLVAAQDRSNAHLSLINARHDAYLAQVTLLAAMGALEVEDLTKASTPYDPKLNFDRVRHAWGWTPWEGAVAAIDRVGAPGIEELPRTLPAKASQMPSP